MVQKVRYVRIESPGNQYLHVQQVQVFNPRGVNIARSRRAEASQSSVGWGGEPDVALDGCTDNWQPWPNSCHTMNGEEEWWQLDLGRSKNVARVIIHNRPDCEQGRLEGATLYLLDKDEEEIEAVELTGDREQSFDFEEEESSEESTEEEEEVEAEEMDVRAKAAHLRGRCMDLYHFSVYVRSLEYNYEMGKYHEDDAEAEEGARNAVYEGIDTMKEKIAELEDVDVDGIPEDKGCMMFREYILDYGREEASYLRTRADMRQSNGPRNAGEGYGKVKTIRWDTSERLNGMSIDYTDGLSRRWGNNTDWKGERTLEDGQFIWSVKYWDTDKRRPGKGMCFIVATPDGDEWTYDPIEALGDKCHKTFGGIHKADEKYNMEGAMVVDLNYEDEHDWNLQGVFTQLRAYPDGDWQEVAGDDWRFEGCQLVVLDKERGIEVRFIPLPHETLKFEHGQIVVDQRLMG